MVLESREEELEARILSWDTSQAIWAELEGLIADRLEGLLPFPELSDCSCEPDHRLLVALRDGVRLPMRRDGPKLRLIDGGKAP